MRDEVEREARRLEDLLGARRYWQQGPGRWVHDEWLIEETANAVVIPVPRPRRLLICPTE